jgi:hypothetical protein
MISQLRALFGGSGVVANTLRRWKIDEGLSKD